MKILPYAARLGLFALLCIAHSDGQTITQVVMVKGTQYVQTSAAGAVVDPRAQGPNYGGPFNFRVNVQGTSISGITAPHVDLAPGSTWPTDNPTHHNGGNLVFNTGDQEWDYGVNANNYGGPTLAGRDAAFAFGDYGMTVTGVSFTLHFPAATTFPINTPVVTLSGGNWVAGRYVIDASQPLTITTNVFTNFDQNADGAMELQVEGNVDQFTFYSSDHAAPKFQTYTIPGGTLAVGTDYRASSSFYGLMDKPAVGGLPGSLIASVYSMETRFVIATADVPGAHATLYRVGFLNQLSSNGGSTISEVRDVTKTGGVIYAVGNSIAYEGSNASDTAFLWTSTNGMTALPQIVDTFTPNPPFVTASAITPDAAYIASRARADSGGNDRHAVRVARSGLTNLDLGVLPGFPQNSAATTISSDGSVMYGFARYITPGKTQAVRFTASGPTITAIPFLNLGDDTSSPAARGSSADGTVMVGTSSNIGISGNNIYHAGNQAFRYVQGSGSTAIPFLSGGTWNDAFGVTPDGNLTVVFGNSTTFPNGELYMHNASNAAITHLGVPTGASSPTNVVGLSSDGSVLAISFSSPTNGNFIHNASGWHSFGSVMTGAGLNLTGWNAGPNTGIQGMSADATLVWGSSVHNGNTEGWIIEFTPGFLATYGAAPHDFNIDGQSDIIWQNTTTGDRALWLMNGTVFVSGVSLGNLAPVWRIAGSADFNRDGRTDILWENSTTGDRMVWMMDGTNHVSTVDMGIVATAWRMAAMADFNGDGNSDIMLENTSTGERVVWLMNGTNITSTISYGTIPTDWRIAASADFNHDGQIDIVWENTVTGQHAIWLMNGTLFVSAVDFGSVPIQWRLATVGDFNADGDADFFWENTVTGDRALWLMHGTVFSSSIYFGSIPTDWHIAP